VTLACVSNPVGGDLISTATFTGVDLRELLMEVGVAPGADQAFSTSVDGWYTGTPVDVLLEQGRGAMLAVGMNGEALPLEHGFPVRMVVPGLYGYVSATKWVTDLELTTFAAKAGYWLKRGWAEQAPIKTQSRIDSPRGYAALPAGRVTVAGIAWSQPTGIGRVEVSMDGGPWQEAELATDVSGDTWRMWRIDFDLAPGGHSVRSRATAADGVLQTEAVADPVPDGATGWPDVAFSVF
jgi:DMSO/TMAO reductase YedYZ molybdopterin-dependent catalytic subunit